ncbi:MAG: KOW domain-containing RNA-binding protein [Clostridiales bacterium]|nr:KOW domain-containing RNA-binding protein [Clostridiales bacterium]
MEIGDIVISLAGHDTDKPFVVVAQVGTDFVLIADGMSRSMESPKLKRKKHLRVVAQSGIENPTNATLKKSIKQFIRDRRLYAEE